MSRLRCACLMALFLLGGTTAQAAERVITLAPHLAELVCEAAGCEVLVAVTAYSDFPPQIKTLPVVGDVAQLNLEAVLALRPTHVIAWQGGTPAAQMARLKAVNVPVTALSFAHLDDVAAALEQIGVLLHREARAKAAARDFRQRLAGLRASHAKATPLRVLYQTETAPVYSINRQSPISEAITLCGGINVFADLPTLAAPVTDEAVVSAHPQVVVHGLDEAPAIEAYWTRFAKAAGSKPRLVAIDSDLLTRSGPRLIRGVRQLCAALDQARKSQP